MIEIRADVKGLDEVKRVFTALPKEIARKALRGALMDGAEIIRREAQRMAPRRAFWPPKRRRGRIVLPGVLKASIVKRVRARPRKGDATVSVGATRRAFYWHIVEFKFRRAFLRRAWTRTSAEAVQRVFKRLGPRIEGIARSLRRRVAKLGG